MDYTSALVRAAQATSTALIENIKPKLKDFIYAETVTPINAEHLLRTIQHSNQPITPEISELIIHASHRMSYNLKRIDLAIGLLSILAQADRQNFDCLTQLALHLQTSGQTQAGLATAYKARKAATHPLDQIFANYLIMRGMMMACNGYFIDFVSDIKQQMVDQIKSLGSQSLSGNSTQMIRLYSVNYWIPYFLDRPQEFREILRFTHTAIATFLKASHPKISEKCDRLRTKPTDRNNIRIGFIGHTFSTHSVGYLLRHLVCNLERSDVHLYALMLLPKNPGEDPLQDWYESCMHTTRHYSTDGPTIASQVADLELDILIDLDSLTLDITQAIMAFHPAKVTMSWLGYDAASNTGTDYYLCDTFTCPESQAQFYQEQLLYLDQLVGVNGFESGLPSLQRSDLDIHDEFVYLVIQRSTKLHPFVFDLYMEILSRTKNSVLILKCPGDNDLIQTFVQNVAATHKIDQHRIKFMPISANEQIHRANIQIMADCILDSYPYSGATTTLESLWNTIPIVTFCGEQVSSRTTASFITALDCAYLGVAHNGPSFIEKAVQLCTIEERYQEYKNRLHTAKTKSHSIWDAETFAHNFKQTILSVLN